MSSRGSAGGMARPRMRPVSGNPLQPFSIAGYTSTAGSGRIKQAGLRLQPSSRRQPDLAQYLHRRKSDTIGGIEIYRELHAVFVRPFDRGR